MSEEQRDQASTPTGTPPADDGGRWERDLLKELATASLVEQRRARRWSYVFKFAMLVYLVVLLILYLPRDMSITSDAEFHTALVNLNGIITDDSDASADRIVGGLRAAFEHEGTSGVILRINSPGGSPVQSGYINDEMHRLREKYPDIPLYAVISDIAASGGYYVAVAADKIYANKSSVIGSIGVLMNGFGFVGTMDKLGVERRLLTSGEHKGLLDPFSPVQQEEAMHLRGLLKRIHQQFIDVVKAGRGARLSDNPDLFSGLIWTGEEGIELGTDRCAWQQRVRRSRGNRCREDCRFQPGGWVAGHARRSSRHKDSLAAVPGARQFRLVNSLAG